MEIVEPTDGADRHGNVWLRKLGLESDSPGPDDWVPVARAFDVDGAGQTSSADASAFVERLERAGIEADSRPYEFVALDPGHFHALGVMSGSHAVIRVAVLVRSRDTASARQIAQAFKREAEAAPPAGPVSDDELTRQALDAGPPPDDATN